MIKFIKFTNFKGLRDATLPLGRFTLIVGPNASGKSSAMEAIFRAANRGNITPAQLRSVGAGEFDVIEIRITDDAGATSRTQWQQLNPSQSRSDGPHLIDSSGQVIGDLAVKSPSLWKTLAGFRRFSFDAKFLSKAVPLTPTVELEENGSTLAGVLDNLRDVDNERYESLNAEIHSWFPEFDRVIFETPEKGTRTFGLRTSIGQHKIMACDLSDGTLLALGYLTLAYLPMPPPLVCFEEPERGLHPRILRRVQEAMYRLAYPEDFGDIREPVQVIATTHSPYLLDLYKDDPQAIIISSKDTLGVHFERLLDKENVVEFLQDAPLGEVWFSGILGGVPANT